MSTKGLLALEFTLTDRSVSDLAAELFTSVLDYFDSNPNKYSVVLTVSVYGEERRLLSSDNTELYRPGYDEIVMRTRLLAGNATRIMKKNQEAIDAQIVVQSGELI
jgi:hypothetical protein